MKSSRELAKEGGGGEGEGEGEGQRHVNDGGMQQALIEKAAKNEL